MLKFLVNVTAHFVVQVVTDSDSDADDDIANMKRKSLIMIEQSLDSPCDVSPLCPRTMKEAEKPGLNIEKLLLERVMLRKELRLRSVQEMLVETSHKLEQVEARRRKAEKGERGAPTQLPVTVQRWGDSQRSAGDAWEQRDEQLHVLLLVDLHDGPHQKVDERHEE